MMQSKMFLGILFTVTLLFSISSIYFLSPYRRGCSFCSDLGFFYYLIWGTCLVSVNWVGFFLAELLAIKPLVIFRNSTLQKWLAGVLIFILGYGVYFLHAEITKSDHILVAPIVLIGFLHFIVRRYEMKINH